MRSPARRRGRPPPPALAYSDADAAYIRKAFEDALEIHARLVYDTMEEAERVRVIKLDDSGAYPIYGGMSAIADAAQFHADRFKRGITGEKWKAASRKAFQKRITDRAVLSVEEFDPVRKMSRLTNAEGVTSEVNTDKPLTHSRPKNAYERREWEQRGDVYVFTRWRVPSVSAREVELYGWGKLVKAAGLVLIGKGDSARYYPSGEVAAVKEKKAEREAKREEYRKREAEENRIREAERNAKAKLEKAEARQREAELEQLRADAEYGRARRECDKLAGTVAPSPSGTSAPVAGSATKPSAIESKLAEKNLQYMKDGRQLSRVFVRKGKWKYDAGDPKEVMQRGGKQYPGVTFFFGRWQETAYSQAQRTVDFVEELIQAFLETLKGNGDGYVMLPNGVTGSRDGGNKLYREWKKSVKDIIRYGRKERKGYARLEMPKTWL